MALGTRGSMEREVKRDQKDLQAFKVTEVSKASKVKQENPARMD